MRLICTVFLINCSDVAKHEVDYVLIIAKRSLKGIVAFGSLGTSRRLSSMVLFEQTDSIYSAVVSCF